MSPEWGSLDNKLSVLPITPQGTELDRNSVNPDNQMFEKRVSGMQELLPLAVLELYQNKASQLSWETLTGNLQLFNSTEIDSCKPGQWTL